MQRFKNYRFVAVVLICLSILIAGCTPTTSNTSSVGTTPAVTTIAATSVATTAGSTTTAAPARDPKWYPSGTPKGTADKTPITLSYYVGDYWCSNYIDPAWTDPVATELTKRTGVTLKITVPASDDEEVELNKLLASNELPDLILKNWGNSRETMQQGQYVKPLDDLIEKYGANLKEFHSKTFDAWRSRTDGKIYSIGYWYFNKVAKPSLNLQINTLIMRYDLLKELGYAKLERKDGDGNSLITMEEYKNLLMQIKAKHPDMIPVLINPTDALHTYHNSHGQPWFSNGFWENNTVVQRFHSAKTLDFVKAINAYYQEGLARREDTTATDEVRKALMADGKVFSTLGYANLVSEVQDQLGKDNPERRFVYFYLRKDESVKDMYINGAWGDSSSGTHINAKLDDAKTKRAMEFIDYCAGPEGSLLVNAGIEGKDFFKDEKTGWYKPEDKIFEAYRSWAAPEFKKRGVGGWLNILPNIAGVTPDGHSYDVNAEFAATSDRWVQYNNTDYKHIAFPGIVSPYGALDTKTQQTATEADSRIGAYAVDRMKNIILSEKVDSIETEYQKFVKQMESDGLADLEKAMLDNWKMVAQKRGVSPEKIVQTLAQSGG